MEDIRRQEVRQLARLTAQLDPTQQIFFQAEYNRHRRNPTTAFLLCLLLGDFGAQYFYFGRYRAGVIRLLFCWTLIPAILALFDARTMVARARRYNASLANELILAIRGTVEEQQHAPEGVVEAAEHAAVAAGRRPALVAPISTPEMDHFAAAAWAGREPLPDDIPGHPLAEAEPDAILLDPSTFDPSSLDTAWPNALARPVRPQPDEPLADVAEDLDALVWPVPAAYLDNMASTDGARAERDTHEPAWAFEPDRTAAPDSLPASAAIAAAAASAAALYANSTPDAWPPAPSADPMRDGAATPAAAEIAETAEREPVLLYQVAPAARREAVRMGPPLPAEYSRDGAGAIAGSNAAYGSNGNRPVDLAAQHTTASARQGKDAHGAQEGVALAALGSALAAGLADLLRDHPRTRPLTRPKPLTTQPLAPFAAEPSQPAPAVAEMPLMWEASTGDDPTTAAASAPGGYAPETGYGAWPLAEPATAESLSRPFANSGWLLDVPQIGAPQLDAPQPVADRSVEHEHDAAAFGNGYAAPLMEGAALAGAADYALSMTNGHEATPPAVASPAEVAPAAPANPAPVAGLTALAANLRRRVVQRVIVRKMAVLDGQVLAESTVERQVPVVNDEAEMAVRIRMATRDAAREALGYLLMQAPEEARPSIREQLEALQSAGA